MSDPNPPDRPAKRRNNRTEGSAGDRAKTGKTPRTPKLGSPDASGNPADVDGSPPQRANIGEILLYALIALVSFVCGIGVLILMLWNAEALTKLGLIGNLFYIVLLPLGLCVAVFLFGVVR